MCWERTGNLVVYKSYLQKGHIPADKASQCIFHLRGNRLTVLPLCATGVIYFK